MLCGGSTDYDPELVNYCLNLLIIKRPHPTVEITPKKRRSHAIPWQNVLIDRRNLIGDDGKRNLRVHKYFNRYCEDNQIPRRCSGVNNKPCPNPRWKENLWDDKDIPLQCDHISGDVTDDRIQNLRWLCGLCHSITETYGAKNIGKRNGTKLISKENIEAPTNKHFI